MAADGLKEGITQAAKDQAINDAKALVIAVDEVKAVAKVEGVTQAVKDQAISDANALVVGLTKADIANAKTAAQARLDTAKIALEKFPAKDITL